jgi:hypothetical protein
MLRVFLSFSFAFLLAISAQAKPIWITQDFQSGKCVELASGDVDKGEDYIKRKCLSFPNASTWIEYHEGVRVSVGFGRLPHLTLNNMDASRGNWPIVWGGEKIKGKFVPKVVIARFAYQTEPPIVGHLFVFRLLDNGMSCIVGDVLNNEKAKSIATVAMTKWKCMGEAQVLSLS